MKVGDKIRVVKDNYHAPIGSIGQVYRNLGAGAVTAVFLKKWPQDGRFYKSYVSFPSEDYLEPVNDAQSE